MMRRTLAVLLSVASCITTLSAAQFNVTTLAGCWKTWFTRRLWC